MSNSKVWMVIVAMLVFCTAVAVSQNVIPVDDVNKLPSEIPVDLGKISPQNALQNLNLPAKNAENKPMTDVSTPKPNKYWEGSVVEAKSQLHADRTTGQTWKAPMDRRNPYVKGHLVIGFKIATRGKYSFSVSKDGLLKTGMPSIDALNVKYGATAQKSIHEFLFPAAYKYGLDLHHVFYIDETADVEAVAKEYAKDANVQFAEPDYLPFLASEVSPRYVAEYGGPLEINGGKQVAGLLPNDYGNAATQHGDWAPLILGVDRARTVSNGTGNGGTRDTFLMLDPQQINITHEDINLNIGATGGTTPTTTTLALQHGHMCTGHAVAEINNSVGICGPGGGEGTNAGILVAYYRYTTSSENATGISWGVGLGVCAIAQSSLYFAGTQVLEAAFKAALDAGAPAFISAGNDRNDQSDMYPAYYSCVTAVGGIDWAGRHWAWDDTSGSNYGNWVGICAPGDAQWSINSNSTNGYVAGYGGTSWAAPEVAAIAAACHHKTGLTGSALRSAVLRTAKNNDHLNAALGFWTIPAGYGGTGIANAYEAVTACNVNAAVDFVSINSAKNNYLNRGDMYLRSFAEPDYNINDTLFMDAASGAHGVYQSDRALVPDVQVYPKAMVHNHGIATKAFNVTATDGAGYNSTKQVVLESGKGQLVTFAGWTPTGTGATTMTVYADLVGDQNHLNDTVKLNLTKTYADTAYMDDGTYDAGYTDANACWATRFQPERSCTLKAFNIYFMKKKNNGAAPAWACTLMVFKAENGQPGALLYQQNQAWATIAGPGWRTIALATPQVIGQPVYIAVKTHGAAVDKAGSDTVSIGFDYRKSSNPTYYYVGNTRTWGELGNDMAIRPVVGYTTVYANDLSVDYLTEPSGSLTKGFGYTPKAQVTNMGSAAFSGNVYCHIDSVGGTRVQKYTSTKAVNMAAGATQIVEFDPYVPGGSGAVTYTVDATVLRTSGTDNVSQNDSIRSALFTVSQSAELKNTATGANPSYFGARYAAVKYSASGPGTVTQVRMWNYTEGAQAVNQCSLFVFADNAGVPGTLLYGPQACGRAQPTAGNHWDTVTVTVPPAVSGVFWAVIWSKGTVTAGSNCYQIEADDPANGADAAHPSMSSTNRSTWSAFTGDYYIYAVVNYASSPAADLGISTLDNPGSVIAPNFSVVPKATVLNGGTTALSGVDVTCTFSNLNGGAQLYTNTQTVASINPNISQQLSFAPFTPTVDSMLMKVKRVGTDDVASNDSLFTKVYTSSLTEINYSDGPSNLWIIDASDGATDTLYRAVRFTPDQPCSLVGMWEFIYRTNTGRAWRACSTFAWNRTNGYKNWPSDRHILQEQYTPVFAGNGGWVRRNITPTYFDAGQDFWLGAWTPPFVAAQCSIFVTTDSRADGRSFFMWNPRDSASNGANYVWLPMFGDWDISALVKFLGGPSLVVKGLVNSVSSETNLHFRTYLTKNLDQVYDETKPGSALSLLTGSQGLWQFDAKNFWPMWNRGDTIVTVVDYEANSGAINHAGSYAVMNDTLLIGVSTQTTNTATLRAIPVPVATKIGSNIQLHWTPPAYDAGKPGINPVIGYRLYRSTNGTTFSAIASKTFYNDTTYTDFGPAGGSTYYYAIKVRYLGSITTKGDPKAIVIESQYTSANSNGILMPLSVEFGQMSAMVKGNDVTIAWRTESETNSYQWEIERAESGNDAYTRLATLPARGNSTVPSSYSFTDRDVPGNTVFVYRVVEVDAAGNRAYHGPVSVGPLQSRPLYYALGQAMPNPFRGTAAISYQLREPGRVSIKIYNISGQLVRTLVNSDQDAKYYSVAWDGTTDRGDKAAAGIYLYKLDVNTFTAMRKLTYLK